MPTKWLISSADIKHLKHQAKDLLSDFRKGHMSAFQRVREFHPKFKGLSDSSCAKKAFNLSDAQLSIAREYGYLSWPKLKAKVAQAQGSNNTLIHNDRIADETFRQALNFLDEGNEALLKKHLEDHPGLAQQQVFFEGGNYFTDPTLIEFVAENPNRRGRLPKNIVQIARIILDAGAKDLQKSIDDTVMLTASGRVAREHGAQVPLLELLCDYGANPNAGMHSALAHGEIEAARLLLARGAALDLSVAAALNMTNDVIRLLPAATEDQLQLALALSALHRLAPVVTMLLEAGADPNRYNPPGGHSHCTPLHSAAFAGDYDTVKALVEGGARCDIGDIHRNMSAIAWAEYAGHTKIVAYLNS